MSIKSMKSNRIVRFPVLSTERKVFGVGSRLFLLF